MRVQPERDQLVARDLEEPLQRKAATRKHSSQPIQDGNQPAATRVAARPAAKSAPPYVIPPSTIAEAPGQPASYAGSIMQESLQRRGTGQPAPHTRQPERPVAAKSASGTMALTSARAANLQQAAPQASTRPIDRVKPSEQLVTIFERGFEQKQSKLPRMTGERAASMPAERERRSAQQEWHELIVMPTGHSNQALIACILICIVLTWVLFSPPVAKFFGVEQQTRSISNWVFSQITPSKPATQAMAYSIPLSAPANEMSLLGKPTITAAQIDAVLASYGSPATGSGRDFYDLGVKYGIDPAFALAFFIHESSAGTNPGWAGIKSDGSTTYNVGNIICAGYSTCYDRFREYGSWSEGIEDWYKLIANEYVNGRGAYTVEQIIPIYAPSFENNVPAYIDAVNGLVRDWRGN